jgi:hypothetical protein
MASKETYTSDKELTELNRSPVPRDVEVKQKVDKWIDDRIQMVIDAYEKR